MNPDTLLKSPNCHALPPPFSTPLSLLYPFSSLFTQKQQHSPPPPPYLEDGFDMGPGGRVSTGHERRTIPSPLLSARHAGADIEQPEVGQLLTAAPRVLVLGVATVDDDVALLQQRGQLVDERVHGVAGCRREGRELEVGKDEQSRRSGKDEDYRSIPMRLTCGNEEAVNDSQPHPSQKCLLGKHTCVAHIPSRGQSKTSFAAVRREWPRHQQLSSNAKVTLWVTEVSHIAILPNPSRTKLH